MQYLRQQQRQQQRRHKLYTCIQKMPTWMTCNIINASVLIPSYRVTFWQLRK